MTAIPGTNLAAPIAPFTTEDVYPTHKALYGQGGWRSVQNIQQRDALPAGRLEEGCVVWVIDTMQAFSYVQGTWHDFGVALPSYATTETVSCFFPAKPPVNSMLVWTAGVDVNFGQELIGVGNVLHAPTNHVLFNVIDPTGSTVATIEINDLGIFSFTINAEETNSSDLIVPAGSYLIFKVVETDNDVLNISFTLTGKRVKLLV